MSIDEAVPIFGKLFRAAELSSTTAFEEGSEGRRFISIGLCTLLATVAPQSVAVEEEDEELPHSVDVDEEDEEIVDRRSLFAEFGRFKLRFEIRDVILSLLTELGRELRLFLPGPRSIADRSLPLPPLVVRSSSYGDSSAIRCVSLTVFSDSCRLSSRDRCAA